MTLSLPPPTPQLPQTDRGNHPVAAPACPEQQHRPSSSLHPLQRVVCTRPTITPAQPSTAAPPGPAAAGGGGGGTTKRGREEIGASAGESTATGGGRKSNRSDPGKPSWLEPVEDGQKRARRPPPRFESSPTSAQEEMIIRQAIENSKIETKLSTDGVASIPEVPTYWCVVLAWPW